MPQADWGFWSVWAIILFLQQLTYLFSGRAKASGSLRYSAVAGLFSHSSWFFSNLYFVASVMHFKESSLWVQSAVCLFYVFWTTLGTLIGQLLALKYEKGSARVGAS
jgi:hypothetical protein